VAQRGGNGGGDDSSLLMGANGGAHRVRGDGNSDDCDVEFLAALFVRGGNGGGVEGFGGNVDAEDHGLGVGGVE